MYGGLNFYRITTSLPSSHSLGYKATMHDS